MPDTSRSTSIVIVTPPTEHQLALMIWGRLSDPDCPQPPSRRLAHDDDAGAAAFVLATIAVPVVIYGLMPQLHRLRVHLLTRTASS